MRRVLYGLLGVCVLILPLTATAHDGGSVRGTLTSESGYPLAYADVRLEGPDGEVEVSVLSLSDGTFLVLAPHPGEYVLRVQYLGYETHVETVDVVAHEVLYVDVVMIPAPIALDEAIVQGERVYSASSSATARAFDLKLRPIRTSQDALQLAPGLYIAQHAGGGKAEQIFLRGFDADHGTDVLVSVDGMPVNLVSHGHGQGYADLHFLIPETIQQVDVRKGPHFVAFGNLATAGAVQFHTMDRLPENSLSYEIGEFATHRVTSLTQLAQGRTSAYLAGQFAATDGPVDEPQDLRRTNLLLKLHHELENGAELTGSIGGFSSAWDASGQIPQRAVDQGLIGRFGSLDPLEGGATSRQNVQMGYRKVTDTGNRLEASAYAFQYRFKLFSNFTFNLDDPTDGDMIEQTDDRTAWGGRLMQVHNHAAGPFPATLTVGGDFRADRAVVTLWQAPDRVRDTVLVDATVFEQNYGLYAQEEIDLTDDLSVQLGLRGDMFTWDVEDRLDAADGDLPHASGYAQDGILLPKVNVRYRATSFLDLFANYGHGFHSNDARAVVLAEQMQTLAETIRRDGGVENDVDAALAANNTDRSTLELETLARAQGAEAGFRARYKRVNFAATGWILDLDQELVWIGDAGTTEPSGETRRIGVDLEARAQVAPWVWLDADLSLSDGRAKDAPDGMDEIPLAPRLVSVGGITVDPPNGVLASLRWRATDDRPANEDNSVVAEGSFLLDLVGEYRFRNVTWRLMVENLLDTEWNEAQFDTESQLPGESEPVSELHFTPGSPRNVRVGMTVAW